LAVVKAIMGQLYIAGLIGELIGKPRVPGNVASAFRPGHKQMIPHDSAGVVRFLAKSVSRFAPGFRFIL
jgi:hypothetical protein